MCNIHCTFYEKGKLSPKKKDENLFRLILLVFDI